MAMLFCVRNIFQHSLSTTIVGSRTYSIAVDIGVMKSEGFKHLKESCPALLSELLSRFASTDKSSTSGKSNKKRSSSSVLGYDTTSVRHVRRRTWDESDAMQVGSKLSRRFSFDRFLYER